MWHGRNGYEGVDKFVSTIKNGQPETVWIFDLDEIKQFEFKHEFKGYDVNTHIY